MRKKKKKKLCILGDLLSPAEKEVQGVGNRTQKIFGAGGRLGSTWEENTLRLRIFLMIGTVCSQPAYNCLDFR